MIWDVAQTLKENTLHWVICHVGLCYVRHWRHCTIDSESIGTGAQAKQLCTGDLVDLPTNQ